MQNKRQRPKGRILMRRIFLKFQDALFRNRKNDMLLESKID